MKIKAKDIEVKLNPAVPGHYRVSFTTPDLKILTAYVNGDLPDLAEVSISEKRKKRSLDANAYMWVLLDKIAAKHRTTAKEVYRQIIQDVGVFSWVMVTPEAKDFYIKQWEERGDGWIAIEYPPRENGIPLKVFYGSSTYDTKEMSRLIDEVVNQAKEDGIETLTPDELKELKEKYR